MQGNARFFLRKAQDRRCYSAEARRVSPWNSAGVARSCFLGPRHVPAGQGKAADLKNRSALPFLGPSFCLSWAAARLSMLRMTALLGFSAAYLAPPFRAFDNECPFPLPGACSTSPYHGRAEWSLAASSVGHTHPPAPTQASQAEVSKPPPRQSAAGHCEPRSPRRGETRSLPHPRLERSAGHLAFPRAVLRPAQSPQPGERS